MRRNIIIEPRTTQKAAMVEIDTDDVVVDSLKEIAPQYREIFGDANERGTYAHYIMNDSADRSNFTVYLNCSDGVSMTLDPALPWNQAETELNDIEGTPTVGLSIVGVVG